MEGVVVLLFVLGTMRSVVIAFCNQDFIPWRSVITALRSLVFAFLWSVVTAFGIFLAHVSLSFPRVARVHPRFSRMILIWPTIGRTGQSSSVTLSIGCTPPTVAWNRTDRRRRAIIVMSDRCEGVVPALDHAVGGALASSIKERDRSKVRVTRDGREAQRKGSIGFRQTIRAKLIATSGVPTSRKVTTSLSARNRPASSGKA